MFIIACLPVCRWPPQQRIELDASIEETAGDAAVTHLDALGTQPAHLLPEAGRSRRQGDAAGGVHHPVPG